MANYKIITDSACDLPKAMLQQLEVITTPLHVLFRGENLEDSVDAGLKEIYDGLRAGEKTSTSAVNPEAWAAAVEPVLAEGCDALVLAFSSGLSTTYQSAVIAAQELQEQYPHRKIRVVLSYPGVLPCSRQTGKENDLSPALPKKRLAAPGGFFAHVSPLRIRIAKPIRSLETSALFGKHLAIGNLL